MLDQLGLSYVTISSCMKYCYLELRRFNFGI